MFVIYLEKVICRLDWSRSGISSTECRSFGLIKKINIWCLLNVFKYSGALGIFETNGCVIALLQLCVRVCYSPSLIQ